MAENTQDFGIQTKRSPSQILSRAEGFYTSFIHSDQNRENQVLEKFQQFEKSIEKYTQSERLVIKKALHLATYAHQENSVVKRRIRKSDGLPYIVHPLEMAQRMVDEDSDFISISATLLHDVPEDSVITDGPQNSEEWLELIQNEFNSIGKIHSLVIGKDRLELGNLMKDLVDGVTEEKLPEDKIERSRIIKDRRLRESPFYKLTESIVLESKKSELGVDTITLTPEDIKSIEDVCFSLTRLFEKALVSPEHLRIFKIKLVDLWHNYQTIEYVKPVKILRAKVGVGLAEWMGWYSMRSELVKLMASELDISSPYKPLAKPKPLKPINGMSLQFSHLERGEGFIDLPKEVLRSLRAVNAQLLKDAGKSFFEKAVAQEKWVETPDAATNGSVLVSWGDGKVGADNFATGWEDTTLTYPEARVKVPRGDFDIIVDAIFPGDVIKKRQINEFMVLKTGLRVHHPTFQWILERIKSSYIEDYFRSQLGRKYTSFRVNPRFPKNGTWYYNFVLVSDEPTYIDYFQRIPKVVDIQTIPESILFHPAFLENDDRRSTHISSLIGFLYDIQAPLRRGEGIISPVIYKNRLYFISGESTWADISADLEFDTSKPLYIKQGNRKKYDTVTTISGAKNPQRIRHYSDISHIHQRLTRVTQNEEEVSDHV